MARRVLVAAATALALGVFGASAASAAETVTFTSQNCSPWTVPAGVTSITIDATGAAGGTAVAGDAVPGKGDGYSGTLSHLTEGEILFVCVDMSGGAGGGTLGTETSGHGGGASGVGYGTNFERPVLVAAGGGGAADQHEGVTGLGDGGNAGEAGHDGTIPNGGGAGTLTEGGEGGIGNFNNGEPGTKFSREAPGRGGAGGANIGDEPEAGAGGGGGYYGGGGGGSGKGAGGGGGGGSDFCGNGATNCEAHPQAGTSSNAGSEPGEAKVAITYTALAQPTFTDECKKGGWKNFGDMFQNQGQCVGFVATGGKHG